MYIFSLYVAAPPTPSTESANAVPFSYTESSSQTQHDKKVKKDWKAKTVKVKGPPIVAKTSRVITCFV